MGFISKEKLLRKEYKKALQDEGKVYRALKKEAREHKYWDKYWEKEKEKKAYNEWKKKITQSDNKFKRKIEKLEKGVLEDTKIFLEHVSTHVNAVRRIPDKRKVRYVLGKYHIDDRIGGRKRSLERLKGASWLTKLGF